MGNFEIIANIATTISLLFLGYQIVKSEKEKQINHAKAEKKKAIELAEIYANDIIPKITYIQAIYREIGIEDELKSVKLEELVHFDSYELREIIGDEKIKSIEEKKGNITADILAKFSRYLNKEIDENTTRKFIERELMKSISDEVASTDIKNSERGRCIENIEEHIESVIENFYSELYYEKEYGDTLRNVLNQLEYFCMYFNTGIADEGTVYQSLHQSFLSIIKVLYVDIAIRNHSGKDKYYTNIISLYTCWAKKYDESSKNEIDKKRESVKLVEKIKR